MKHLTIFGALVLAAGSAHADPRPEAPSYLGVNGVVGSNLGLTTAVALDGGHRISEAPLYAHVQLAAGQFDDLSEAIGGTGTMPFAHGSGRFVQGRGGLELHSCTATGVACAIYGADLGMLVSSPSTGPTTDTPSSRYLEEQVVPRVALDVGGTRVRARLGVELAVGASQRRGGGADASEVGLEGTVLTGGLAYRF